MKIKNKVILALAAMFGISLPVLALNHKSVKAENAQPEIALYEATNAAEEFKMVGETTLRLDGNGLRFKAKLSESVYNKIDDDTTKLCFMIMPESYKNHFAADYSKAIVRNADGTVDKANSYCLYLSVPKTAIGSYDGDDAYYALAGISPVHKNNYKLNFSAIAALETKTADGYSYEYATDVFAASEYDTLLSAVLGDDAPYTEISEYYAWFGGDGYPVEITDNVNYGKLKAKLSERYFGDKYFVFTKEVTDYRADDFAALTGVNITKFYGVTLNANGATSCDSLEQYTYGDGAILPVPEKTGYTFGGWYASEDFSGSAVEQILSTDAGDKTFYARWVENVTLTLGGKTDVQLYDTNDFTVDFSDIDGDIDGELNNVTVDDSAFITKTYASGVLTLDTQTLGATTGDRTVTAEFVKTNASGAVIKVTKVTASLDVATMLISNEAELNSWLSVCYDNYDRAGVYKLANDIYCTGTYKNKANFTSTWAYDKEFVGTFDGQGYSIVNFRPNNGGAYSGLLACLGVGGTVKNVSFLKAKVAQGSIVAALCHGTIENVYIQMSEFYGELGINNGGWGSAASIIANEACKDASTYINNVIVDYDCEVPSDAKAGYPVFMAVNGTDKGHYNGVYGIGVTKLTPNNDELNGTYGAYADYAAMKAANIDFSSWSTDFWQIADGLVYPKKVALVKPSLSANKVQPGETVTVNGSGILSITLSSDTIALGVTISGRTITIPASVEAGSDLAITVTDIFGDVTDLAIKVLGSKTINIDDIIGVQTRNEENFTVDLSSVASEIEGTLESVSFEGVNFVAPTYSNGILTLNSAILTDYLGERNVTARFVSESGVITLVNFKIDVVTMLIHNESELNEWINVCYSSDAKRAGVYKLANDIYCTGTYRNKANFTTTWAYDKEFVGTFDGQGYSIVNFRPNNGGAYSGLLACLGVGGTVKNVSFLKAKANNGAVVAALCHGTIENVYIQVSEYVNTVGSNASGWGSAASIIANEACKDASTYINNVIVDYECEVPSDAQYGYPVFTAVSGTDKGHYNGVYGIGISKLTPNDDELNGTYGAYDDYEALVVAGINFTSSASDFWAYDESGRPYPKRLTVEDIEDPYGLRNKSELTIEFTHGYYQSKTSGTTISTDLSNFRATKKIFTKEEIPVGSVIWVASGWAYRPEGWTNGVNSGSRPDNISVTYVVVTEEWWGSYTQRAFNLSKGNTDLTSDTQYTDEFMSTVFKIYVPKNA